MVLVWVVFTLAVFVVEPLWLQRRLRAGAQGDSQRLMRLVERLHWFVLLASLLTIAGAVAGSHGWLLGRQ